MSKETRKVGKDLTKKQLREKLRKVKWRKDHRGIIYNKKTGIVTAI